MTVRPLPSFSMIRHNVSVVCIALIVQGILAFRVARLVLPRNGNFQWEYPNQRLTEFLQQEQIAFIDLLPEFRRYMQCRGRSMPRTEDDLYWMYDDHPNVKRNRLAGFLIGREMLERSVIPFEDMSRRLQDITQRLHSEDECSASLSRG